MNRQFIPPQDIGWPCERSNRDVSLLARGINRRTDIPVRLGVWIEAREGEIRVIFSWRNTDVSQNHNIQIVIMEFAQNGFLEAVRPLLKEQLKWKNVKTPTGSRRSATSFVVTLRRVV